MQITVFANLYIGNRNHSPFHRLTQYFYANVNDKLPGVIQNEFNEYDFEQGNKLKDESPCESKQEKGKGLKGGSPLESPCICDRPKEKKNPPKIYFCTRTHRQIAQIIRELNKTEFRQVRILISKF